LEVSIMAKDKLLREWMTGGRRWRLVAECRGQLWRVYLQRDEGRGWAYADTEGMASEKVAIIEEHVHELAERADRIGRRAAAEWARCFAEPEAVPT
jgi:hypothetical protein